MQTAVPARSKPSRVPRAASAGARPDSGARARAGTSTGIENVARREAHSGLAELHLRDRCFGGTPGPLREGTRVRITGHAKAELNGRHGTVLGPAGATGRRHVALEGLGRESDSATLALRDALLVPAPPAAADTVYNVGTGAYEAKTYKNNGLPRRCRTGSGAPSYSTRRPRESAPVPPPEAGSLLPRHAPPADYTTALREGTLPVRIHGGGAGGLRWIDPYTGAEVSREEVDAHHWLPRLIDGLRDTESPSGAYLALRAAIELSGSVARGGALPPLMPAMAPSLKAALELRERSVVCAALKLLLLLLRADPRAGLALRPHYRQLLPALAAFKLPSQPSLGDEVEHSQHRRVNVADLVDETLAAMEELGGQGAGALIKSFVPSFQRADEVLHRGFR